MENLNRKNDWVDLTVCFALFIGNPCFICFVDESPNTPICCSIQFKLKAT